MKDLIKFTLTKHATLHVCVCTHPLMHALAVLWNNRTTKWTQNHTDTSWHGSDSLWQQQTCWRQKIQCT